mmetsp:Transcript_38280/g.92345  ORF Transcript_38280/g.92345 Transcript_38280/m.92345 type:complete len:563 (+) Transcript_38280:187-1875(+)
MPHLLSPAPGKTAASDSPSKAAATKPSKIGEGVMPAKRKRKHKLTKNDPLFAFDVVVEEYNWERPKRKIKSITRFDPTAKVKQSDCKIGQGFTCPRCSGFCNYDSRKCFYCDLECYYEAGVGVVVLQDRRISYRTDISEKKNSRIGKKGSAAGDKGGKSTHVKSTPRGANSECNSKKKTASNSINNDEDKSNNHHAIQSNSLKGGVKSRGKKNIFANLKEKIQVAAKSNSESQQENIDDSLASNVEIATKEWTESTIAASKDGDSSTTSSSNPPTSQDDHESIEGVAKKPEPPSWENDINCCQDLKQQLLTLQSTCDSISASFSNAEEEFRITISKLEGYIRMRNQDAAEFTNLFVSSSDKIAEIKKRVASLSTERDEFVKKVEAKGLSSVPKITPNYSTRIDSLDTKMLRIRSECDSAKERVKDLMSGTEVWKQERDRSAKELEYMETKHGETFTQCYKEIESFKRQLSEATCKMSTMATDKAVLVGKVSSTLLYVSKVRSTAEAQTNKIEELKLSIESLTSQRDAATEEKEDAIAKTKSLEDTVNALRNQIEYLQRQNNW